MKPSNISYDPSDGWKIGDRPLPTRRGEQVKADDIRILYSQIRPVKPDSLNIHTGDDLTLGGVPLPKFMYDDDQLVFFVLDPSEQAYIKKLDTPEEIALAMNLYEWTYHKFVEIPEDKLQKATFQALKKYMSSTE